MPQKWIVSHGMSQHFCSVLQGEMCNTSPACDINAVITSTSGVEEKQYQYLREVRLHLSAGFKFQI
jgi:hypothetical protein